MPTLIDEEMYPQGTDVEAASRPRASSAMIVLMFAACTLSYLIAYAAPGALVSADILKPWPSYDDPRPRWMVTSFVLLLGSFILITMFFRMLSRLSMRRIDAMTEDL